MFHMTQRLSNVQVASRLYTRSFMGNHGVVRSRMLLPYSMSKVVALPYTDCLTLFLPTHGLLPLALQGSGSGFDSKTSKGSGARCLMRMDCCF